MDNEITITPAALDTLSPGSYLLIDLRDEVTRTYGMLPGAVAVPEEERAQRAAGFAQVILYCVRGRESLPAAEALREQGVNAFSLEGGYTGWLMHRMDVDQEEADRRAEIESGLQRSWHKRLFTPFAKACRDYELLSPGDRVAVCISGGKDSMLMAKLFQELQRHRKFPFELVFLMMDPGYNTENRRLIEHNARLLGIDLHIFETDIFGTVYRQEKNPCYLCARMRRGHLYAEAQRLGCNKIALGHHYDDVIETTLMGMLYGGQLQGMLPKLHSTNFPGMELIRPMYFIRESDIMVWRDRFGLHFIQCACRFTDTCTSCREDGSSVSKRMETKRLIAQLKKTNPDIEAHIFRSTENVCLDTLLGWKTGGVAHSFLDDYNSKE